MWRLVKTLRCLLRNNVNDVCRPASNVQQCTTRENDSAKHENQASKRTTNTVTCSSCDTEHSQSNGNKSRLNGGKRTCDNNRQCPPLDASFCSFLEAIGCGTALLFGLQYVALRQKEKQRNSAIQPIGQGRQIVPTTSSLLSNLIFASSNRFLLHRILPEAKEIPLAFSSALKVEVESDPTTPFAEEQQVPEATDATPTEDQVWASVVSASRDMEKIADMFVATIQNNVGISLARESQSTQALSFFLAGCELGDAKACFNAGVCYETGLGTAKDLNKAKAFYEAAAERGHGTAMYNLGVFYMNGLANLPKDEDRALALLESAADKGVKEAQRFIGIHFMEHGQMEKAVLYLKAASQLKDPDAEFYLGVCCENGWGTEENAAKAVDLYSQAAKKGHADAAYNLGVFYELGAGGLPQHLATAKEWYQNAAAAGHSDATMRLSELQQKNNLEHDLNELLKPRNDDAFFGEEFSTRLHTSASAPEIYSSKPVFRSDKGHLESKSNSTNILGDLFASSQCQTYPTVQRGGDFHSPCETAMHQVSWVQV